MTKTKTNKQTKKNPKAWVVSVDMGYGHQRAAYPLKYLAYQKIIDANNYRGIPERDKNIWRQSRRFYEFISRFKKVPVVGRWAFNVFDKLQHIEDFYPKRDLSNSTFQVNRVVNLIKDGWGKHLIDKLEKNPLPLVTTFFVPAFMAQIHDYSREIYCLATDTDISRSWVMDHPGVSRINYFAPSYRVVDRLILYGIRKDRIYLTGFPLPIENLGYDGLEVLKNDLGYRLVNLDPKRKYLTEYRHAIEVEIGRQNIRRKPSHPLTLMFAVGGAGAQKELGIRIVQSLKTRIKRNEVNINLVAGIRNEVHQYFKSNVKALGLGAMLDKNIKIIYGNTKPDYFEKFNKALRTTDIIWTKPSELSFYVALGIPIIMSPPIGSQEIFNKKWLTTIGAAISQENPKYADQWLFDWLDSGWFAEAAMHGVREATQYGAYNIEKIVSQKQEEVRELKTVLQY
ncbi:MAG TPA: hypothetical protein VGA49_01790 [Patescibacteria group bacterium]